MRRPEQSYAGIRAGLEDRNAHSDDKDSREAQWKEVKTGSGNANGCAYSHEDAGAYQAEAISLVPQ
jgi:hypothetical protein